METPALANTPYNDFTFQEMVTNMWSMLKEEWTLRGLTSSPFSDFSRDFKHYNHLEAYDFYMIGIWAVLFTLHRYIVTWLILKVSKITVFSCLFFYKAW